MKTFNYFYHLTLTLTDHPPSPAALLPAHGPREALPPGVLLHLSGLQPPQTARAEAGQQTALHLLSPPGKVKSLYQDYIPLGNTLGSLHRIERDFLWLFMTSIGGIQQFGLTSRLLPRRIINEAIPPSLIYLCCCSVLQVFLSEPLPPDLSQRLPDLLQG